MIQIIQNIPVLEVQKNLHPDRSEVIFEFIKTQSKLMRPVEKMCNILDVSTSGYYDWKERELSNMKWKNKEIE